MDTSRFLIVGANGQLGRALQSKYPKAIAADRSVLDITNTESVEKFNWSKIDVILNAAAYNKVDIAETPEGRRDAWAANATAPAHLARIATAKNLTLLHVSTDYVYDGTQPNAHSEDAPLAPLSGYASSKAAGDIAAQVTPNHYVLRTSWVIGDGPNFVRTMIGLAEKNISPTVVADQIGRLTFTDTLVEAIDLLITKKAPVGVYNVSNGGEPGSWAEVTRAIFKALGREDLTVTDTTTEAYFASKPGVAPRPLNSVFDLSKITAAGLSPRDWRETLVNYVKQQ
ncbi:MAG TPA: NAD(P)-dependent oxidoreductase [Magnetospirillaceae bacterium]|nr:NAD(P)-dependent oxidoreductase [Magnetospirillaceae bacterium]